MPNPTGRQSELQPSNYGHFGLPSYNQTSKAWFFPKLTTKPARSFVQLGSNVEVLAPPTGCAEATTFLHDRTDAIKQRYDWAFDSELRQLAAACPEIQPGEEWIVPAARLSEGIAKALEEYDPARSEMFATGTISHATEEGRRSYKLLALPGGEGGEALRLIRLQEQTYTSESHGEFEVEQASEETGVWTGKGAPILQLCFSRGIEGSHHNALLAVRLQGCIMIMFPRYRREPIPSTGVGTSQSRLYSRIDPNILFELPSSQAHGTTFADIAFNPWNNRELLVIDQAGHWTIFKIARQSRQYPVYAPELLHQGHIPTVVENEDPSAETVRHSDAEELFDSKPASPRPEAGSAEPTRRVQPRRSASRGRSESVVDEKVVASRQASPVFHGNMRASPVSSGSEYTPEDEEMQDAEVEQQPQEEDGEVREEAKTAPKIREDGWARACWVLNDNALVLCSRKEIYVVDKTTGECFDLPKMRKIGTSWAGWFLDIKLCYDRPDHVFILTSHSIFLLRVSVSVETEDGQAKDVYQGSIVASVLHYRDPVDTSLRVNVADEGQGCFITLLSQWNKMMTSFRFDMPDGPDGHTAVSPAISLELPTNISTKTSDLLIQRVASDDDTNHGWRKAGDLFSVQFLGRDFGLRRSFYETREASPKVRAAAAPQRLVVPSPVLEQHARSRRSFVVPDDDPGSTDEADLNAGQPADNEERADINDEDVATRQVGPIITTKSGRRGQLSSFLETATACAKNHGLDGETLVPVMGVGLLKERMESIMDDEGEDAERLPETVFERTGGAMPLIADVQDDASTLDKVLGLSSAALEVKAYPSYFPTSKRFANVSNDDLPESRLESIHDHLVETYIATLDESFSPAFRAQRERLAKSIAAELTLASARVERRIHNDEDAHSLRKRRISVVSTPPSTPGMTQFDEMDEDLPATPGLDLAKPGITSPYEVPLTDNINTIINRLSRNVKIQPKASQKWSLKPLVMLSHWEIGADPADYSYTRTANRLEEEKLSLGLSEREKRKRQRKQERDRIRRERESRHTQEMALGSSQAPLIISSQVSRVGETQDSLFQFQQPQGLPLSALPISSGQVQVQGSRESRMPSGLAMASPASQLQSSQVPSIRSSQIPFGEDLQPHGLPTMVPKIRQGSGSQRALPGFGSSQISTPSRPRAVPGFGGQASQAGPSRPRSAFASTDDSISTAGAGPSGTQQRGGDFKLPERPGMAPSASHYRQSAASQIVDSSQAVPSSQQTMAGSQRPSQFGSSQTPRKKPKRMAGF